MANFVKKETKPKKPDGNNLFADFTFGLYNLDTPRSIGEQLASLALKGGRNIWAERGALIAQHGYTVTGQLDENDIIALVTREAANTDTFFIVTVSGKVYIYIAGQGLKRYKTTFGQSLANPVGARRGSDLILSDSGTNWLFGGYYSEATPVVIDENITAEDFDPSYEFTVPYESRHYYWNNKAIMVNNVACTVVNVRVDDESEICRVRATANVESEFVTFSNPVSISEKTLKSTDFIFTPESSSSSPVTIIPKLMNIANNRLFIVDEQNRIFYSAVGNVDSFEESNGAGYFYGFYNDNSQVLSIEDYMTGCLICKENGVYYLSLTGANFSTVQGTYLTLSENQVHITRISQIGQQYASDHVIIRNVVYAYDSHSGSIVVAAQPNYYNNGIVAGNTIVSNEFLNAQDSGIDTSRRFFTYNSEFDIITLYYGERLNRGILLTSQGSLFPRELDMTVNSYVGFSQGVVGVSEDGKIFQDFKKGTIIPNLTPIAEFEAIGLRDNRLICSTMLEVTELNGVRYHLTTANAGYSYQEIIPYSELQEDGVLLPNMMYSDKNNNVIYDSFELVSKWANKTSNVTRMYAPMSGREGVSLTLEFPENTQFCLAALRLPDFSQGE